MEEKCISSTHVQKLGHNLQEIRERALMNIVSKLERGFLYDNELARCKELLHKLFDWFKFDNITHESVVLDLLKCILKTESGGMLISLFGASELKQDLAGIKNVISSDFHDTIEEIVHLLDANTSSDNVVPPLQSDVPLSYRSDDDSLQFNVVGSTATPIEVFARGSASIQAKSRNEKKSTDRTTPTQSFSLPYYTLPWQSLVAPDRHVLESVEDTLRNPTDPAGLLNSCDFFNNILLHDFPAEVFLQRPSIIKLFHDLLWSSPSSRITTAILTCLNKFTGALKTRILFYSDPCTFEVQNTLDLHYISKQIINADSLNSSPVSESHGIPPRLPMREQPEETVFLMKKQMNLPQYCLNTMNSVFDYLYISPGTGDGFKRKKCQIGINTALLLLTDCIHLLKTCIGKEIWNESEDEVIKANITKVIGVFAKFGEVLEHFRLEVMASDWQEDVRMIHLYLLCSFCELFNNLISETTDCDDILPKNLKNAISNSLLDPSFSRLYPRYHEDLVIITKKFIGSYQTNSFRKYEEVQEICRSMSAAVLFLRNSKSSSTVTNIRMAKAAVLSLELHKCLGILNGFVELCANKLSMHSFEEDILDDIDYVIVSALAHKCDDIKLETYKLCQKKVTATIGAKLNVSKSSAPGSQILFLLREKVLQEMILYGMTDINIEVQNYAEDILLHIAKCKILVPDDVWEQAIVAMIPVMPLLICHVNKSSLGRTILSILDPDRSASSNIPACEVIKENIALLFLESSAIREEAVSRLCWLLSSDKKGTGLLPRINNLHDRALGIICQVKRAVDYKHYKNSQHFYQPSGLHQVLELLNSANVEPVIRRSAVTQVSVMTEDPMLHKTFLHNNGVDTIKKIMATALKEGDYRDYPDSVIGCITVLKNICLYHATVRQELSNDVEVYTYILRGMFMFCTDERIKQDGSILLFLLIFSNYVLGTPMKNDLSLPDLVLNKLKCPFQCNGHWKVSKNSMPTLKDLLTDKWALTSLQIHWNLEWFGGIDELLKFVSLKYDKTVTFNDALKMSSNDLLAVKSTSLEYNLETHLEEIESLQSCYSSLEIKKHVNLLTTCVYLYGLVKDNQNGFKCRKFTDFPWERSFEKFLTTPPSGTDDNLILAHVLQFLCTLVPIFKHEGQHSWIVSILKDGNHYFSDLLGLDCIRDTDMRSLMEAVLELIKISARSEQYYLNFHVHRRENTETNWNHLVDVIVEHLQFSEAQHFYNLAYLDHILSTLVQLTSTFGWSNSRKDEPPRKLIKQLSVGLCELIGAFHCGKGPSAADSVMGLSITRHVILILNHVLAEMRHFKVKNWEECFLSNDINGENDVAHLCSLRLSRDVVLRAGIYHLLAGIASSTRACVDLVQDVRLDGEDIWEVVLGSLLNHEEASTVKENAAMLLTNLSSHTTLIGEDVALIKSVLPTNAKWRINSEDGNKIILKFLNNCNFFNELQTILSNLYVENDIHFQDGKCITDTRRNKAKKDELIYLYTKTMELTSDSLRSNGTPELVNPSLYISTPGFIKSLSMFVHNLLIVAPAQVCSHLLEHGLVKLFLRCLVLPSVEIQNTKELSLYCDILEMNTVLCMLLAAAASENLGCLSIISNTQDCLSIMISLLNPAIYHTSFSQLFYLRNKLWSSIFNLMEVLLMHNDGDFTKSCDVFSIIASIIEENGQESFLQSLCQSIGSNDSMDLQLSALSSLTSLLKYGSSGEEKSDAETARSSLSMQTLLDFTKTPRTQRSQDDIVKSDKLTSFNVLETIYFGKYGSNKDEIAEKTDEAQESDMAGAELCKILLHLYDVVNLKSSMGCQKKRMVIINTLTSLLSISFEAKTCALKNGLLPKIVDFIKEIFIKLSIESLDCLRRISDKKRVCPVLKELESLIGLLTNFMYNDGRVKNSAANLGLADISHKLWVWFCLQKPLLVSALKMLSTFTNDCYSACQSIPFTSCVAGSGPRKAPSNISLLQAVSIVVGKEMEQVSRTHDLTVLQLCFQILHNCIIVTDCRVILVKCNLLGGILRLHPAITKRQKPWESIELLWLEFLNEFTIFPEGQMIVAKLPDVLELLITLATGNRSENKQIALEVLRNISFYQPNRARLLTSADFLNILSTKLSVGSLCEKNIIVSIVWTLAANNQKAKLVFKCAHIDAKLLEVIRTLQLNKCEIDPGDFERMHLVLKLLREGEKSR